MTSLVDKIAEAVLYEGHVLYPYRPSVKNQHRWTFGGVYPRGFCDAQQAGDAWAMQTEFLVHGFTSVSVTATVRFLHPLQRQVGRLDFPLPLWPEHGAPPFQFVECLEVGPEQARPWQESIERTVAIGEVHPWEVRDRPRFVEFEFPASRRLEPLRAPGGPYVGLFVRDQRSLRGRIQITAEAVDTALWRMMVRIENQTVLDDPAELSRDAALLRTLVSTHVVLHVRDGDFVSLIDPPAGWREAAAQCRNIGAWPVLVGEPGQKHTLQAAPIILYDYPQIAPESPGDLNDATEIDEILTLRIKTLTEDEKHAMAGLDERTRAMLARTERLVPDQLQDLHGRLRTVTTTPPLECSAGAQQPWNPWDERPAVASVTVAGVELKAGDHVRLRPRGRADIFDLALDGKTACIESIEQDFEDQIHLAVTIDIDPGRDFGRQRQPGHQFFFRPEEVEPLGDWSAEEAPLTKD